MGYLAERKDQGQHTFTKFYGSSMSWMAAFAPTGKRAGRYPCVGEERTPPRTRW